MNMETYKLVTQALNNAADNGYTFEGAGVKAIAADLARYDSGLEEVDFKEMTDPIMHWLEDRATCPHGFLVGCPTC